MARREVYEFGDCTLDVGERKFIKKGTAVDLPPKAFDMLVVLVRNGGRLVRKNELLAAVWPESFVEEGILAVHVSHLRRILGNEQYIETVPRAGYRWLSGVGMRPVLPGHTSDVYELFGRGRAHLLATSVAEAPQALADFEAAVRLDPMYAAAHAGLALAWCAQAYFRLVPHTEAYQRAKTAALAALALDSSSADAQTALGNVLFLSEWNWTGAERSLRRALELNPNHTEAHLSYGRLLEALGRCDEGLRVKQKALEREPFSPAVHLEIALSCWVQRRYEETVEWANRTLALDPDHLFAGEIIAAVYWMRSEYEQYVLQVIRLAEHFGSPCELIDALKKVYAEGGWSTLLRGTITQMESMGHLAPAVPLAIHYGKAGDLDAAFRHLGRALEDRDPAMVLLGVAPNWDCLRPDPRFNDCLARMGLPQSSLVAFKQDV
jgi:tetratricopeptide (TPR) repeat protein